MQLLPIHPDQNRVRLLARVVIVLAVAALLAWSSSALFFRAADAASTHVETVSVRGEGAAVNRVLSYQGRLLDPATGAPKTDGNYNMTFRLYNVASGGSPIWTESKSLAVSNGLFSTLLGDTTALNTDNFDGQDLYLGVTVGSDPETSPRHRLAYSAYALYAVDADTLDGQDSAAFAGTGHTHSGGDIDSGTVADGRIAGSIARDSEVVGIASASGEFADAAHNHDGQYVNSSGTDSMSGNSDSDPILSVAQSGSEDGILATTASIDPGEAAVHGEAGAAGPTINGAAGVLGSSENQRGVIGSSVNSDGVLGFSDSDTGVDGQSVNGTGVRAFSQNGTALDVQGDGKVTGDLEVGGTISNPMAPIAMAFINASGSKSVGSSNVSSVFSSNRYEITIAGYNYSYNQFVTIVTPSGCNNSTVRTNSIGGTRLLVYIYDSTGSLIPCDFQFVTYQP